MLVTYYWLLVRSNGIPQGRELKDVFLPIWNEVFTIFISMQHPNLEW